MVIKCKVDEIQSAEKLAEGNETHEETAERWCTEWTAGILVWRNGHWWRLVGFILLQFRIQFSLFSLEIDAHFLTCLLNTDISHPRALEESGYINILPFSLNMLCAPLQASLCPPIRHQSILYNSTLPCDLWSIIL